MFPSSHPDIQSSIQLPPQSSDPFGGLDRRPSQVATAAYLQRYLDNPSLGLTTLAAYGIDPIASRILIMAGFVTGPWGERLPVNILPDPKGDAYLQFMAVPLLRAGETAVCLPLLPGILDYYRGQGIVPRGADVLEVPLSRIDKNRIGYPYTSPLALVHETGQGLPAADYLVATFPDRRAVEKVFFRGLRAVMPQVFDPARANNKADFRERATEYGWQMLPGRVLKEVGDIQWCCEEFGADSKVWMKLAHGSGGDLVISFDRPGDLDSYKNGLRRLRASIRDGLMHTSFGEKAIEEFWPQEDLLPKISQVIVERDAGHLGVVRNMSKNLILTQSGEIDLGYFGQLTSLSDGTYQGSYSLTPDKKIQDLIDRQVERAIPYFKDELKLRGYIGFDYFVVEDGAGDSQVYLVECNARDTISSRTTMLAGKLGDPFSMNVNFQLPSVIRSFSDIRDALTLDGIDLTDRGNGLGVSIIPFAVRSLYSDSGSLLLGSPGMKVYIGAQEREKVDHVLQRLGAENGIKLF